MKQLVFSLDVSRCSGCMACVVACQDQNDFAGNGIAFRHVTAYEEGHFPAARISYFSIACYHCGDAPCVMVCPTGAIFKRNKNGLVDLDRTLCVGCHSCEMACPFGAPKFAADGKMAKCDMCYYRIENDMDPACVRVCPTKALKIGPIEELSEHKAEHASVSILKSLI